MEKSKEKMSIVPANLQLFMNTYIKPYEKELGKFIGYRDKILVEIHTDPKYVFFSFSPKTNIISIPQHWIKTFLKLQESGQEGDEYTINQLKYTLYHEASHFRDLLMERELQGRASMLATLKRIGNATISIDESDGKKGNIPIGEVIHDLYNCVDDVVVNHEVIGYKYNNFDMDFLNTTYKKVNFKHMLPAEGGEYDKNGEYVGQGNGVLTINIDKPVDYSKKKLHTAFSYFLLRYNMVPNQEIILPNIIRTILYKEDGKSYNSIKQSYSKLIEIMEVQREKHSASPRYKKIEKSYSNYIIKLKEILIDKMSPKGYISNILKILKQKIVGFENKYSIGTLSLFDIVELFTYSSGSSQKHSLDVLPSLRYKIMEEIFEPLYKGLIFLSLLEQDLEEKKPGEGEGEREGEGEGEREREGEEKEYDNGILQDFDPNDHKSLTLEEKIKIIEQESNIIEQEYIRKKTEITKYDLNDIFKNIEVEPKTITMVKYISQTYHKEIQEFVDFLGNELKQLDRKIDEFIELSKKGNLNYNQAIKEISSDPIGLELYKKNIYDMKILREVINEDIKKIDFTLLIDISGSMDNLKGKKGILNIIVTIFGTAMSHLETKMQNILNDKNYKIPINYILYGNDIVYDSYAENQKDTFQKDHSEVKVVKINDKIISESGGTLDSVARQKASERYDAFLSNHPEYVKDIEENKRKSVIIQISDSDVTENGVEHIKNMLGKYGEKFKKHFYAPRRIIIGTRNIKEYTEEQYKYIEKIGQLGNWDIKEITKNGKIRLRQANIMKIKEILPQLKNLFKGFFDDLV